MSVVGEILDVFGSALNLKLGLGLALGLALGLFLGLFLWPSPILFKTKTKIG
jgi:hypothetical protein